MREGEAAFRGKTLGKFLIAGPFATALVLAGLALSARAQQTTALNLPDAPSPLTAYDSSSQDPTSPLPATGTCTISGTVLDTNNDVIQGARVVLADRAGIEHAMESGPNGQFAFAALFPGSYKITVTGKDMGTYVSPWLTMHPGQMRIVSQVVLPVATAASSVTVNGDRAEINQQLANMQVEIAEQQRVWGVFPNFY